MTQQYYTRISQESFFINIEIRNSPHPFSGAIEAAKRLDFEKGEPVILPATVRFNVTFGESLPGEIERITRWIEAGRFIASQLDQLITEPDHFNRRLKIIDNGTPLGGPAVVVESEENQ